ncbi:peptidase inhibitor family I36 protein [Streptomyces litmocidini]|uniref:peptidase inhibitor family I36 protein n=1 Tax=Streptomyces TaxID=1883 RepID=UPI000F48CEBD|nr:peptidase inhibitor family I36 protein [Streptomyces sp. PanSC19]ROQ36285.1 peptidase inhibitor family I36 [Streptomyces sp. PanSC19]
MTTSRFLTSAAAAFLVLTGSLAAAAPAGAVDCPSGQFCAWEHADYQGQRANWQGDDGWWEGYIADNDSSWANHGIVGPGIPAHVQIFDGAWQGGDMTLCLAPGQEVSWNGVANDRGDSHRWAHGC